MVANRLGPSNHDRYANSRIELHNYFTGANLVTVPVSVEAGTNTTTTTVELLGTPNQNYTIEYSTDLAIWSLYLGNPVNTGTGTFSVTVSAPGNHKEFFFRASE